MEPSGSELAENIIKIKVAFFQMGDGGVASVGTTDRTADAETAFREIESVSDRAPDSVIGNPLDERGIHAALHDEILDKTPDRIVRKRRNHTRTLAETSAETARHIIFAAAFPCGKRPCGMDSSRTGIESEHYLSERENVVLALIGCFDFHFLIP